MNFLKKLFCRAFQTGFRLIYPFLPYREPHRLDDVVQIVDAMRKEKVSHPLLVTDSFLRKSGVTKRLEDALSAEKIAYSVYDGTRPNPTTENVAEGLDLYRKNGCDCLIAFGGGSAMDCAKAVGALIAYPKRNLNGIKGNLRIYRRLPTLFAVPTTAGTGSEVTLTAVVTDEVKKHKYTINAFPLIPHYAVLDPNVTFTLPAHLTATTGMDAMTHAIEAYIGQSTTRETRQLSKDAVKLVVENVETAYLEPENRQARANMLLAAYKAGIAFSKSYVGYIHAVAHSLGGQYNIPHGLSNAVLLPIGLEFYGKKVEKQLYELAVYANVAKEEDTYEVGAKKMIAKIKQMNRSMHIGEKLAGIVAEDIPQMAKHADREGNPLYPVPILMNQEELKVFYNRVADWSNE